MENRIAASIIASACAFSVIFTLAMVLTQNATAHHLPEKTLSIVAFNAYREGQMTAQMDVSMGRIAFTNVGGPPPPPELLEFYDTLLKGTGMHIRFPGCVINEYTDSFETGYWSVMEAAQLDRFGRKNIEALQKKQKAYYDQLYKN